MEASLLVQTYSLEEGKGQKGKMKPEAESLSWQIELLRALADWLLTGLSQQLA